MKVTRYDWTWNDILYDVDEVIELYKAITVKMRLCLRQPIFLDLIIKLLIAKSYILMVLQKTVKASDVLNLARELIDSITEGQLMIISFQEFPQHRPDAYHYPLEILK